MILSLQYKIKNDPNLHRYLREHSNWYKNLNRDPNSIFQMEQEMKEKYKLTTEDRINQLADQINLIRTFMDMMN